MLIPNEAFVAVVDGETLNLFQNTSKDGAPSLVAMSVPDVDAGDRSSGGRHQSNAANPDDSQQTEDGFAAGVVAMLNAQVMAGNVGDLVIIAAPRTLGEMRKHYHKTLSAKLLGEVAKDLTGHSLQDIEKAVANA